MIMNGPVSPERQAVSRLNYKRFVSINGLSYMCLGEVVLILLAIQLHCSDATVSILGAMIYFGFLLLPVGKVVMARLGAARSQGTFWVMRNVSGLLVAAAPLINHCFGHWPAVAALLTGAFLFYGFRAAGNVGVQPLLGELSSKSDCGKFISETHALFYAFCCIGLIAVSVVVHYLPGIWTLSCIIIAGALLGLTASYFVSRIDETGAIRDSAKKPIWSDVKSLWCDTAVRRMLAGGFVINLAMIMLLPTSMLALKRGVGVNDTAALIFAFIQLLASVIFSSPAAKAGRKIGARRVMIISYLLMMLIGICWVLMPFSKRNWLLLAIPFILCGGTFIATNNSMIHYFLQTVEEKNRVAVSVMNAVITGAGAGAAGMFCSGMLLKCIELLTGWSQSPVFYKTYFAAAILLLLPGLRILSLMKPLPFEKRIRQKSWFDFLW